MDYEKHQPAHSGHNPQKPARHKNRRVRTNQQAPAPRLDQLIYHDKNEHKSHRHHRHDHSDKQDRPSPLRVVHDRKPTADIIAGRQPVLEALRSGRLIEKIVILGGVKGSAIENIRQMAKKNRVPFIEVGKMKFRDLVSDTTTQGVVAIVGTKTYVEVDDILQKAQGRKEQPFVLILDEIEDPQNLGALIRTAECAGVHGVVIPKHHAASINQTVSKTSAGASEHVLATKVTNIATTLDELKEKGIWVVGTDSDAEKLYTDIDYQGPIALVIGNEGKGVRQLVKEKCDFIVKIPLLGKIQSLNASVAGGLMMYEVVRQRRSNAPNPYHEPTEKLEKVNNESIENEMEISGEEEDNFNK
ncbi:MAG: 23S rRNA (guanosine(2251)-2'-O)-methyltransferase RlmB [Ignavibacteriales bacterium]|nr:23S rRNA (guanosine(2251)-2'-O)-methyltransferase RlmB [Ignavibacteriales bacterium]